MASLSYKLNKKGLLNTPGITHASKTVAEELLLKDAEQHHSFFNQSKFYNHLSHHILAAYDLGAPPDHLKKIYVESAKIQRPKFLSDEDKNIDINKGNWKQYLGNQSAYGSFVRFFSNEILELGVDNALEKYVFEKEANEPGVDMLNRVMTGLVHPFIQIGYGAEFSNDTLVATGLSGAAIHANVPNFHVDTSPPTKSITLFELLEKLYASESLKPAPYNPQYSNILFDHQILDILANGGAAEIEKLCSDWHISDTISDVELTQRSEELIWLVTLLLFGTGKKGRKPKLDFFLMHLLTSSLFIRPFFSVIKKQEYKAALLRAYIPVVVMVILTRGRPRINAELIMQYTAVPRPPFVQPYGEPTEQALGNPGDDADYNPWPALIESVRYHSDSHVLKAMRTLLFAAQQFGDTPPGCVIGTFRTNAKGKKEETLQDIGKVDGTIFVRAAGILIDTLGWSGYGQHESTFDFTGVGWDEAWVEREE